MSQVRATINPFQHPEFPDYVSQVEFDPQRDTFFASFGYALALRACQMKSLTQSPIYKLHELVSALQSTALQNMINIINRVGSESDSISALNNYYQQGNCNYLAESIKAILIPRLLKDGKTSFAQNVEDRKSVDIETDFYFNALMSEIDIAIQLYKDDGTHRTIHRQNARVSISLYVDEFLNWSVLIHKKEEEFQRTNDANLLRSFPFMFGENSRCLPKMKPTKIEIPQKPTEPDDPDLVLKQAIESLAGIADKQRIPTDRGLKNDLQKIFQELHKLKPNWKLKQLEDLENYISSLGNCNHENKMQTFTTCGATHCVECMKEMIIREKIKSKENLKCPCGQKVTPKEIVDFRISDVLIGSGQKPCSNEKGKKNSTAPLTNTKFQEQTNPSSPSKNHPALYSICFICNERISSRDTRKDIDRQFAHEKCALANTLNNSVIPEPPQNYRPSEIPEPPQNYRPFGIPEPPQNYRPSGIPEPPQIQKYRPPGIPEPLQNYRPIGIPEPPQMPNYNHPGIPINPAMIIPPPASIVMKKCNLCKLSTTPSNIFCDRNHPPVCNECAAKHYNGKCNFCKTIGYVCYFCRRPIDTCNELYGVSQDGFFAHSLCFSKFN